MTVSMTDIKALYCLAYARSESPVWADNASNQWC